MSDYLEAQIAAFLDFHARRGGPYEDNLRAWLRSKSFTPLAERILARRVREELIARAELTPDYGDVA